MTSVELVRDASWCWFGDPRALVHNGRLYYGWCDTRGRVMVAQYDPATGARRRAQVGSYLNSAGVPMVDDHANPSIIMRGGRLCVFWSWHAGTDMRYRVAAAADSIEAFGPELVCSAGNVAGGSGFTYPNPVDMTAHGGQVWLFWRGGNFQPCYSRTTGSILANSWTSARHLFSVPGGARPYVKVFGEDVRGLIHFAMTDGHPRDVSTSIYYARLNVADGTIRRANGGMLGTLAAVDAGTPIPVANLDLVYDGSAGSGNPRGWVWDVQADADGLPVVAFATVPGRSGHGYHVARATGVAGGGFDVTDVCDGGPSIAQDIEDQYSGGIMLDPSDLSRVTVSRVGVDDPFAGPWHRLEEWAQAGAGGGWGRAAVLTDGLQQDVRPYYARNAPVTMPRRRLWVSGTYGTFVDYTTGLALG